MGKDTIKDMVKNQFVKKVSSQSHLIEVWKKMEKNKDYNVMEEYSEKGFDKYTYDFSDDDFNKTIPIRNVRRFQKLPYELKEKLKVVFQFKPIMDGGCHHNSLYLSTLIDGVEKVDGWIDSIGNPKKYRKIKDLGNGLYKCEYKQNKLTDREKLSNEIFGLDDNGGLEFIYNEKTNTKYLKHSWNKYGDIHFDTTLGIFWNLGLTEKGVDVNKGWGWSDGDGRWINYFGLPNTPKPNDDEKEKLLCMCDIVSMLDGCKNWVMNRGVIYPMVYGVIGGGENDGYKTNYKIPYDERKIQQHQLNYLEMSV